MKKVMRIVAIFLSTMIIMISLCACNIFQKEEISINQKINTEISYLDSEIIFIANEINNINYDKYRVEVEDMQSTSKDAEGANSGASSGKQSSEGKNSKEGGGEVESSSSSGGGSQEGGSGGENAKKTESGGGSSASESEKTSGGSSSGKEQEKSSGNKDKEGTGIGEEDDKKQKIFSMEANNVLGKDKTINWESIRSKVENLYTAWITVSIDLKSIGASEESLRQFANGIDKISVAVKSEDKIETINSLISVYDFLPEFAGMYEEGRQDQPVLECKSSLLKCYSYASSYDWDKLKEGIDELKNNYWNIVQKKSSYVGKDINIESVGVVVAEIENSLTIKDEEVFFIKYKSMMQELNIIMSS